ncbi:MAG: hypothetical protein FWD57_15775, partial [Polyangiaceae bacterium]|nr:hypothetical protein [Polyangiaceae bacterium]
NAPMGADAMGADPLGAAPLGADLLGADPGSDWPGKPYASNSVAWWRILDVRAFDEDVLSCGGR